MTTTVVALIIVLSVLIFFHEFGHFLVARWFGVGVERFSLGFGPRLAGFTRGLTDYRLSAIPLGGYVKMVGEDPDEPLEAADIPLSFTHKPVLQRILIVAAGPVFNLLLAVLIFYGLFLVRGTGTLKPVIGEVQADMPAQAAGLSAGDRVVSLNGQPVEAWGIMAEMIENSGGRPLTLTVVRDGQQRQVTVSPRLVEGITIFGEPKKRYVLGIVASGEVTPIRLGPLTALSESLRQTWEIIHLTVLGVAKMVSGTVSTKELGGPILIAQLAGKTAQQGAGSLLAFIAFISINLAILNFLPIPVLDGGHLLFFTIEAVRRRPVSIRTREIAQQFGLAVILLLMILVFYNDITRLLG